MATGKQGCGSTAESQHLVSAQREKEMHVQAPLTAMYIQAVPALPSHPPAQPAAMQDAAVLPLSMPMMLASQTLPFLTLHITSGTALQQQKPELSASSPRPKSAGKHVCPHCGRDCLKPSVLEKHLRCHTGERPYPCPTCGISFKTQSNLYKHKRTQAHARLSSESGKETFSSQESIDSSRDFCFSPSVELQREDSGDSKRRDSVLCTVSESTDQLCSAKTRSDTEWALCKAAVVGLIASPAHGQQEILNPASYKTSLTSEDKTDTALIQTKSPTRDARSPLTPNRTPLQRQEALLPKLSRGKSQSHDSTDSGFSESNEHHLTTSPGDTLHNPSMDSALSMELQKLGDSESPTDEATDDTKNKVSFQEKQKLEEHILKLISENNLLMDDKQLVNVRPRKTVLSKQGSIDLPMPYTYKDSFHFEMRSSKHQVSISQTQDRRGRAIYSSMPTQYSTSMEHAPLTRSSSLPYSINNCNSDKTVLPYQEDKVPMSRRCSSGHIYPFKSVDQHAPSHRLLVRQAAVDCLSTAEGSSVERGSHTSLSSVEDFTDNVETGVKRCHRKKAQKFPYNKWYMYGDGTFKKLYNTEKDSALKSRKVCSDQTEIKMNQTSQEKDSLSMSESITSCSNVCRPPAVNMLIANTPSQVISSYVLLQSPMKQSNNPLQQCLANQTNISSSCDLTIMTKEKDTGSELNLFNQVPSERKKQKTDDVIKAVVGDNDKQIMKKQCFTSTSQQANSNLCQPLPLKLSDLPQRTLSAQQKDSGGGFTNLPTSKPRQIFKRHSSPHFVANVSRAASPSISSVSSTETSFLPKYQLKIPSSTDGVSNSSFGKPSLLNMSLPSLQPLQQTHSSTTSAQSVATSTTSTLCSTAITQTDTVTSMEYIEPSKPKHQCQPSIYTAASISISPTILSPFPQNKPGNLLTQNQCTSRQVNSMSSSPSSMLTKPRQTFTDMDQCQSSTVSTRQDTASLCQSTTSTANTNNCSGSTMSALHNNSATAVVIERQPPESITETLVPGCKTFIGGIPLDISHTGFPEAKDTFYVQTPDLQIFMQLISDEQLAQIEPHIETPGYMSSGSHSFFSKDMDISENKIQKGVPQDRHKQCLRDTGSKECESVNTSVLGQIPDVSQTLFGSTVTEPKAKNTSDCDVCLTNTRGIISKTEHHFSASLDSKAITSGQQYKLSTAPEGSSVLKKPESAECRIQSYSIQRPSEIVNEPSLGISATKCGQEPSNFSTDNRISGNFLPLSRVEENIQDVQVCPKTSHSFVSTINKTTTLSRETSLKATYFLDTSVVSKPSETRHQNQQSVVMTLQKQKSQLVSKTLTSDEGEMTRTKIPEASRLKSASISTSQVKLASTEEPSQPKSHWSSYNSTRTTSSVSILLSQSKSLECTSANQCPNYEVQQDKTCNQGGHDSSTVGVEVSSDKAEEPKTVHLTLDHFKSHRPIQAKCTEKESIDCEQVSIGLLSGYQDTSTVPPVSHSLQNPELQWVAGTGSWRWTPQEDTKIGGDCGVGILDRNVTGMKQEEDGMKNKKKEATYSHESYKTTVQPHPHQHETNLTTSSSQLGTFSLSTTAAICDATNPPQDSAPLGQRECLHNSEKVVSKPISQNNTKELKQLSPGSQEQFISLPKRQNEARHTKCGHHLAHPLLVNSIQKKVQKETDKINTECNSCLKQSQIQKPLLDHKTDETPMSSVQNELLMTSFCNTESSQIAKNTPYETFSPCSIPTNKSCINTNPICTSNNTTEPNAPQCQMDVCYLEEEEERSSSSDDEGKLVINLE